jgi:hypothetical protein
MPGRGRPFQPGQSGNPGGRPKDVENLRQIAREYAPEAFLRLVELMRDKDPRVAVAACKEILDRGFGRPQPSTDQEKDQPIHIYFRDAPKGTGPRIESPQSPQPPVVINLS